MSNEISYQNLHLHLILEKNTTILVLPHLIRLIRLVHLIQVHQKTILRTSNQMKIFLPHHLMMIRKVGIVF